ncbi:DUF6461 domain-containing protein [Actinacidiphila yeochonensis]|uniref:DUF6461 domain-containing protein n=1 Tax=Actinacidiphila yeochonensis TaxID=89050 RepID=UPI000A630A47|nr:DUF6461 domain-containing protein [Actinacidiphila yeochonensis]
MLEMRQFTRLGDEPLTSRDGRHVLRYDVDGVASLTDTATGEVRWRAGGKGALLLGGDGALHTEDDGRRPLWTADLGHRDAVRLVVTDDGDLALLGDDGARLAGSRTEDPGTVELRGSAPAAAITETAHLIRPGRNRWSVARVRDGGLVVHQRTSGAGLASTLPAPLARWFEQDGAELTWRQVPERRGRSWRLVLVDAAGELLWRSTSHDAPADPPPSTPYAYGGHELPAGGRLRHQSLTSPNGSHTLVHQENGDLVLYCNSAQRKVWATDTWWAGNGWADLTGGDLVVRTLYGAPLWRAGTTGATRLVVGDDGTIALDGTSWVVDVHAGCTRPGMNTARGDTLLPGQALQRQSLTASDGSTVFAHRDDRRLVGYAPDGTWLWDEYVWDAERSYLALDEDGMLRVHGVDGSVAMEVDGPADALVVTAEGVELRRDGTPFWRNGRRVAPESWDDWMSALMDDTAYCVTLVRDVEPAEALRRLLGDDTVIHDGTWRDLRALSTDPDADWKDAFAAAFRVGGHTLLVEENGWAGVNRPELSAGTFAVACFRNINALSSFVVLRDGAIVADHSWDNGSAEPTTPEVRAALAAMGSDDPVDTAFEHDLELFCRTAGVRITVADVTGPCLYATDAKEHAQEQAQEHGR